MRKLTLSRFIDKSKNGSNGFVNGYPKGEQIAFVKKRVFEADRSITAMQIHIEKSLGEKKLRYQEKLEEWKSELEGWLDTYKYLVSKKEFKTTKDELTHA